MRDEKVSLWPSLLVFLLFCFFLLRLLWQAGVGPHNRFEIAQLQTQLAQIEAANTEAQTHNQQLEAEIDDLRNGLEIVEEHARYDLNMIRPGETLVHYSE